MGAPLLGSPSASASGHASPRAFACRPARRGRDQNALAGRSDWSHLGCRRHAAAAIGYGILAFAPLGASFSATAALLGIYTAIFAGIVAAALGGSTIQVTGPKAPLTLIVASLVTQLVLDPRLPAVAPFREALVVGLVGLTVLLGGVVQIAFGILGLGNLMRYVPRPVVAGFLNGIACTLIIGQVPVLLGWDNKSVDWTIQPLTLAIGLTTMVVILQAPASSRSCPHP